MGLSCATWFSTPIGTTTLAYTRRRCRETGVHDVLREDMARPTGVGRAGTHSAFRHIPIEAAEDWSRSRARALDSESVLRIRAREPCFERTAGLGASSARSAGRRRRTKAALFRN